LKIATGEDPRLRYLGALGGPRFGLGAGVGCRQRPLLVAAVGLRTRSSHGGGRPGLRGVCICFDGADG